MGKQNRILVWKREDVNNIGRPPKKRKKNHNSCELWGGQQILVCEPQKSAFFIANFPKKHAEINS